MSELIEQWSKIPLGWPNNRSEALKQVLLDLDSRIPAKQSETVKPLPTVTPDLQITEWPKDGYRKAIHVFTPALVHCLKNGGAMPVMAVRSESDQFGTMQLYHRVHIRGPSVLEPMFGTPLVGTDGRGVAIIMTQAKLTMEWYYTPHSIICAGRSAEDILAEVKEKYVH